MVGHLVSCCFPLLMAGRSESKNLLGLNINNRHYPKQHDPNNPPPIAVCMPKLFCNQDCDKLHRCGAKAWFLSIVKPVI